MSSSSWEVCIVGGGAATSRKGPQSAVEQLCYSGRLFLQRCPIHTTAHVLFFNVTLTLIFENWSLSFLPLNLDGHL